jgi:hypothetical protein
MECSRSSRLTTELPSPSTALALQKTTACNGFVSVFGPQVYSVEAGYRIEVNVQAVGWPLVFPACLANGKSRALGNLYHEDPDCGTCLFQISKMVVRRRVVRLGIRLYPSSSGHGIASK